MIQIDDAGSGSFVGGTCIGFLRPETNEYYYGIIPVELYGRQNFRKKLYLDAVVDITKEAFAVLEVRKGEWIQICRGYMFEKLKKWLDDENHTYCCTHITGKIQEAVEKNFELYTISLGLPQNYIKYTRYPFHFHKLLRWVYADYENRIHLCKVGWKSWSKYENITARSAYSTMEVSNAYCLKCGQKIDLGEEIKIISFVSNQTQYVITHRYCPEEMHNADSDLPRPGSY